MANWRAFVLVAFVLSAIGSVHAADAARFTFADGHLAAQVGESDWQGLRVGDSIPPSSHLRTSPAGSVRIELPGGVLFLASDSDADLDTASRRIVINRGRILVRNLAEEGQGAWTVVIGTTTFQCPPGSEAEISYAETIGMNLLAGVIQVKQPNAAVDQPLMTAPLEWVGNEQGIAKSSVPSDEGWASRIRRRTEPRDAQGLGQLIAKDAQSGSPVRLEVARYHVNVVLQPPVALVQIDQSFFNPYLQQNEGTFVFNLPEGASVSRFAMFVTPEKLIEGELIERKRADQIYTSIVTKRRDPAILEQIGSNLFRMRVFPIFARDTKRILLDYTVPLVAERGRYHFELPLMSDLKPIWDFGMTGVLHPPFLASSISSQSHPDLKFVEEKDGSMRFRQRAQNIKPPSNMLIDFRAVSDRQPMVRSYTTDTDDQHFVVTLPESANPGPLVSKEPVDLLVLVDTSGSANNLSHTRLAARTLINNLGLQDRWQLGSLDVGFRSITSDWMAPRTPQARASLRRLDELFALGTSNLDAAMEEALSVFAKSPENRRRVVVYVGDGDAVPSSDRSCWQHPYFRGDAANRVEFHALKLGNENPSGQWMRDGMSRSKGRVFRFNGNTVAVRDLFEWALAGMPSATSIVSCSAENVPAEDLFYDNVWPAGRELHIFGRRKLRRSPLIKLELKLANQPEQVHQIRLEDQQREEDVFTGRSWARQKLSSLLSTTPGDDAAGTESIVLLCQEWSLMSPYTAFLVLETEDDYQRWNIPRQVRRRYWKPLGVAETLPIHEYLRQLAAQRSIQGQRPNPQQPARTVKLNVEHRELDWNQGHLDAAKQALAKHNPTAAMTHLAALRIDAKHAHWAPYESLLTEAKKGLRREGILNRLKLWQSLADRRSPNPLPAIAPLVFGFPHGNVNSEYLERHPHAMTLLKPTPKFDSQEMTVKEFAEAVQGAVGIPIIIDQKALADEGISADQTAFSKPLQGVPLKTIIDLSLDALLLKLVPEPLIWRITTQTVADEKMATHVYPVIDLVRNDVLPLPSRLANPNLDYSTGQRRANELRLKRPITARFADNPLVDVLDDIFEQMGGAKVWVDQKAMSDEGISIDQTVSMTSKALPAEVVLREILSPLLLECVEKDGVFVVTTQTVANEHLETRVYSAAGIVDENALDPNFKKRGFNGMWGAGNFGGMMGGGMGGMGGGMMGGMGGGFFGGGGGAAGGQANPPNANANANAGLADVAPPQIDESETELESTSAPDAVSSNNLPQFASMIPQMGAYNLGAQILQQSTPGKWEEVDGDGGRISFHRPSFSFVIRQTQRVHAELKELFAKLRRQPTAVRAGSSILRKQNRFDAPTALDYGSLMLAIRQSTPGKWEEVDGDGGRQSPHPLTNSLVIRQTDRVHEEIEQLLVQLRRARYVAESLPWQTSLEGIDDIVTYLDRPTITDLPRNNLEAKPADPTLADKTKMLEVRKVPVGINQRWRNLSKVTGLRREFAIRKQFARLELVLSDRTMRAEGPRGAVAYPGLTLVELDAWGDAVRQMADLSLPWLLHYTNEELAQLFDVTLESENETSTTLRLAFPNCADTYLKATFAKASGLPIKWQSVVGDETQYELQFDKKSVIAIDPSGNELERWELIADYFVGAVPPLAQSWDDFIIVESSKPDSLLAKARDALRNGDNASATKAFEKLLEDRPQQPLLNFLYAWSIGVGGEIDASLARSQREALVRLAKSGAGDLLRLVTPTSFPSIGTDRLRKIFLSVPEERRTEDVWDRLSDLATEQNRFDLALAETDRAIAATTDPAARIRREVSRVELLLKNARPMEAETAAKALAESGVTPMQLVELGGIFGRADQQEVSQFFFEKYRQNANLTPEEQSELAYRHATSLRKGEMRWRLIIAADAKRSKDQISYIGMIVSEATEPKDAEILGKLASELPPGIAQTQLRMRQADLTDDKKLAAEIVLKLLMENQIPDSRIEWEIGLLTQDNRAKEVIEILEQRLRKRGTIERSLLAYLAVAYQSLGRDADFRRANSDESELRQPTKALQ